jgi:hypothetical protein
MNIAAPLTDRARRGPGHPCYCRVNHRSERRRDRHLWLGCRTFRLRLLTVHLIALAVPHGRIRDRGGANGPRQRAYT